MSSEIQEAAFAESDALGAPPEVANSPWVVLKFGGSSVGKAANWQTIASVLRNRIAAGLRPLVVHSAIAGASNALERILADARAGDAAAEIEALKQAHRELAGELAVDAALLDPYFDEVDRLAAGVALVGEVSPRVHVRMASLGELMATRLGAAWLNANGVPTEWLDVREILQSEHAPRRSIAQNYLSASCEDTADPALAERLGASGKVVLTQGYIARNAAGETVLLGREGSDTSAAYLAARLQARRLEIWTDVPGMFSADPRQVPSARLLAELHFDEAQELASTGSRVLHPRCLAPVERYRIPLFIRCTSAPQVSGTVVSAVTSDNEPRVKGVSVRRKVTLISMEGTAMWQEVGFLAEAFQKFAKHGVSIDLVSTSQTNVTVSIETADHMLTPEVQRALLADLDELCTATVIEGCAVVSLVGRRIRTILPRIAPVLRLFDEEKIHLVSQAANDLNFSFVVDESQLARLLSRIHSAVIPADGGSRVFGPSWQALATDVTPPHAEPGTWWRNKRDELLAIMAERPHAFVYDLECVRQAARRLQSLRAVDRVLYAMKANFNADILRQLAALGVDFECVSPGEVEHLQASVPGLDPQRILFTPNFAPRAEYEWALDSGLQVTLDNLYPLRTWPELFAGRKLFIRVDPGRGRGHHEHVRTGGASSKFGVPRNEIDELERLVSEAGAEVIGIHAHSGSGILDPDNWREVAAALAAVADRFPQVEVLDLGGGFGVPERGGDSGLDLEALDRLLLEVREAFPRYRLWLEPGRYLVAEAGVLLTRVTQTKGKEGERYVGVNTGMNSLIRPALYGAYHEIVNLSRAAEVASETVTVVGPICESGDKLGLDRLLPPSNEGDILLIANAGAYGRVMSSRYNLREPAEELVI